MKRLESQVRPTVAFGSLAFLLAVSLTATAIMSGCRKRAHEMAPVNGKVIYRGEPLQFGNVMFMPESGPPATGIIASNGTFTMITRGEGDGASVGKNQVRIGCFDTQSPSYKSPGSASGLVTEASLGKALIPRKYLSYETSGITVEVRSGVNEPFILNLKD